MKATMKMKERTIWIMAPVLAISIGFLVPNATAKSDPYPKMAPVDQYIVCSEKTVSEFDPFRGSHLGAAKEGKMAPDLL